MSIRFSEAEIHSNFRAAQPAAHAPIWYKTGGSAMRGRAPRVHKRSTVPDHESVARLGTTSRSNVTREQPWRLRGDSADDHKINVTVVEAVQNLEKIDRHGVAVA